MSKSILVATAHYGYLASKIAAALPDQFETEGWLKRDSFKDGETYHRWLQQLKGREVVIVGGTIDDTEFMEVCDLVSMSKAYKADHVTLLIPFFGYQTMERATKYGEDVKAKNRAHVLSYLPRARNGLDVVMFDLHSEGIPQYFENNVDTAHLYSKGLVRGVVDELRAYGKLYMGATDAGRAKWVDSLARELNLGVGFVLKNRSGKDQVEETAVSARVRGGNIFIFDDLLRTGGTATTAALAFRRKGAKMIWLMCSHGVPPEDSLVKLMAAIDEKGAPLFSGLYLTDSHPRAVEAAAQHPAFVKIVGSAPVFAEYLEHGTGFNLGN